MTQLTEEKCVPCSGKEPKATEDEIQQYLKDVPDWERIDQDSEPKIRREFDFDDFAGALKFTQKVGDLAEEQDHHPTLITEWGKVTVIWYTHKIGGLHKNDFIMAARTDEAYKEMKS